MYKIKAIVFDLGGVLVDLDLPRCRRAFIDNLGYSKIDSLLDASHQKGIYSELEEGKISADRFRELILEDSAPGSLPEDVDRSMWALLGEMESRKVAFLKELSQFYDLYLLTNNNPISIRRCHEILLESGLDHRNVFKKEFISSEMKMLKPGAEIYRAIIKEIGLPGGEIMFVDDSMANVEAACAEGIKGVHYVQGEDLRKTVLAALEGD